MKHACTVAVALAVLAGPALAEGVQVVNYSWLQQWKTASDMGCAFVGYIDGATGDSVTVANPTGGYGYPDDFRASAHVWIPSAVLTGYGTLAYWAAVDLGTQRYVEKVSVQWWAGEGTGIQTYTIQAGSGSDINNLTWTTIGSYTFTEDSDPSMQRDKARFGMTDNNAVTVTAGDYQYIRILMEAGDYGYDLDNGGRTNRGGPGLYMIEPIGSGTLTAGEKVNWLHQQFSTSEAPITIMSYGAGYGGGDRSGKQNTGFFTDEGGGNRTGADVGQWATFDKDGQMGSGAYIELNLGVARTIDEVAIAWSNEYYATGFTLQYLVLVDDEENWVSVVGDAPYSISPNKAGVTGFTFEPVTAQQWRIFDPTGSTHNNHIILDQIMLYGTVVPEPATMGLLVLGGLALLRKRR